MGEMSRRGRERGWKSPTCDSWTLVNDGQTAVQDLTGQQLSVLLIR